MKLAEQIKKICEEEAHSTDGFVTRVMERAKEAGIQVCFTGLAPDTSRYGYEEVWEHERITEHNKTAHIMQCGFLTLYSLPDGPSTGFGIGGVYPIPEVTLVFGRLGNTKAFNFGEYR